MSKSIFSMLIRMKQQSKLMQRVSILLLLCMGFTSCQSQPQDAQNNATIEERAATLKEYYEKASNSTGEERAKYEQLFFDAFPSSFEEMQQFFGYGENKGVAPLYDYNIELDREGKSIISFFYNLSHIDKEQHYNKYIDICIGGKWEADNISEGFDIGAKLYYDTEAMTSVLSKRTDKEIKSVFRFVFEGPHPNERKGSYEELYNKVKPVNPNVADLMKQSYEQLLAEDDGHGH